MTRADIASILRDTADKLDAGGEITIDAGGDSITVGDDVELIAADA